LWWKYRFSKKQKTMLANATLEDEPERWRSLIGAARFEGFDNKEAAKYQAAADDLAQRGFFLKEKDEYSLTREGWKIAVILTNGRFDSKVGFMVTT
jgi:hypothetical protein